MALPKLHMDGGADRLGVLGGGVLPILSTYSEIRSFDRPLTSRIGTVREAPWLSWIASYLKSGTIVSVRRGCINHISLNCDSVI